MKLGILLLAFSIAAFADTTPVISEKLLTYHQTHCPRFGSEVGKYARREVYSLPSTKTLYILGCEMYAYNSMEKAYIVDQTGAINDVNVVQIDSEGSLSATSDLMGTMFDEQSNTLRTYQKGRGYGDCGSAATYSYNAVEEKFILREARIKDNCDGDVDSQWPVVYSK